MTYPVGGEILSKPIWECAHSEEARGAVSVRRLFLTACQEQRSVVTVELHCVPGTGEGPATGTVWASSELTVWMGR